MYAKKNSTKKLVATLLALVLLIGCTIGGTLAWLAAQTTPVVNTFTVGGIELELTETFNTKSEGAAEDAGPDKWVGKLVPGITISKDPKVAVKANSEACWLFVEIEETETDTTHIVNLSSDNAAATTYITYTVADGWTAVTGYSGVYYRQVSAEDAAAGNEANPYQILADNKVSVPGTVTEAMLKDSAASNLKLTITAYAIQSDYLTKADAEVNDAKTAWELLTAQIATDTP